MPPRTIIANPTGPSNTLSFSLPPGVSIDVEAVLAAVDATAAGDTTALLEIADSSGAVIARKRQTEVIAGGTNPGSATWSLRLADDGSGAPSPPPLDTTDGVLSVNPTSELFVGAGLHLGNPAPGVAALSAGTPEVTLDYVENPNDVAILSANEAAPTFVISSHPFVLAAPQRLRVEYRVMAIDGAGGTDIGIFVNLWDGVTNLGRIAYNDVTPGSGATYMAFNFSVVVFRIFAAGAHTLKIGVWYQHAGSVGTGFAYGSDFGLAVPMALRVATA